MGDAPIRRARSAVLLASWLPRLKPSVAYGVDVAETTPFAGSVNLEPDSDTARRQQKIRHFKRFSSRSDVWPRHGTRFTPQSRQLLQVRPITLAGRRGGAAWSPAPSGDRKDTRMPRHSPRSRTCTRLPTETRTPLRQGPSPSSAQAHPWQARRLDAACSVPRRRPQREHERLRDGSAPRDASPLRKPGLRAGSSGRYQR